MTNDTDTLSGVFNLTADLVAHKDDILDLIYLSVEIGLVFVVVGVIVGIMGVIVSKAKTGFK